MSDVPTDLPANDAKQDVKQEASKLEALAHRLLCADPDDSDTSEFDQQLKNIRDKGKDFAHEVFKQAKQDDTARTHLDGNNGSDLIIFYADPPKTKQDAQLDKNKNYIAGGFDHDKPYSTSTMTPAPNLRSVCKESFN
jgi:hypothetical protein